MRFALAWGLVFALTVPALSFEIGRRPRRGQTIIETPPPVEPVKVDSDTWDAVYLDGQKAGYIHTTVREEKQDGKTVRKVQRELNLTVKRFGQLAEVKAQVGTSETPEGKVLGLSLTQSLGKNVKLALTGRVSGDRLLLTLQGESPEANREVSIPWDDAAIGLLGEENLLRDRRAKPGDKFSYRMFEPTVNNIVTTHVAVKNWETVPLNGVARKLLRVETKPEKIQQVQLPMQTLWYDEAYRPVTSQVEMPGLGELTLRRTTQAEAQKPTGELRDMSDLQSIVLNRLISRPHEQPNIVYRITFAKGEDLDKMFPAGDDRQFVKLVGDKQIELRISAVRKPANKEDAKKPAEEFTKSNFFITSDDKLVQKHATDAVGEEADAWKKAQLVESWVHRNMRVLNFSEAMSPASEVARTLEGDCTEYAMLAAAMCRVAGVPSRTAIGLVYHVDLGQPKLSYHMWTEVWVNGSWLALDATLGTGSVGPAHLKITDHSWYETRSMTPLLPVLRVMMNKPKVEVTKVGNAE